MRSGTMCAAFGGALLAALIIQGCVSRATEEKKAEQPGTEAGTVTLTKQSIADCGLSVFTTKPQPLRGELSAPAKVLTNQDLEAQVGSLVQGRVHRVYVNIGDAVQAGQVLMTVEGLDVGAIKAGFLKAKAAHDYAKAAYERQKRLFDENAGSQKALLDVQAEYEKALAEFTAEDRKIHSVGLADEDIMNGKGGADHTAGTLPIKSPIGGVIAERNVVVGQYVDAAVNAFRVIDTRSVCVDGQIYEKDLPKLGAKTSAVFITSAYPNETFTGTITNIGQTVDGQSRTITVRGRFANPRMKLKPQMFGELKIPIGADARALMVPQEAVANSAHQDYVFVQTGDTTFEKRNVVTGVSAGSMVEIKEGLKEGEKVVAKGVYYLKGDLLKAELSGDED